MTKKKIFLTVAILLIFVAVFGTGTSAFAYQAETEIRYADAPMLSTYADETIYFTRKEVTLENNTAGNCPAYSTISGLTNSCGAVAGAQIVAFYDKYFPNLIPGWTSHYTNGKYRAQDSTYVPALIRELYTLMRTNVDDVGVSESDFLNGLTSYVNGKGYQISYQSVKSGNAINLTQCVNAIDNNKVIALLVAPTNVYNLSETSTYDTLTAFNIAGSHIMVAYGYLQFKYYNASGLFRTDTYLCVSTGKSDCPKAYYKIDSTATKSAYIVNVQ